MEKVANRKSNLAKNTLLLSIGTFMTKGLSFVMVPLFSRWLSTSDYGTFDLFCTYISLLIPIIGLASNEAVFRFSVDKKTNKEKAVYVTNDFILFTFNSFIVYIVVLIIYRLSHWEYAFSFFFLLLGELYNIYLRGFLRGIKKLDIFAFANVITTFCTAIFVTVLIKVFSLGLHGIILGNAGGFLIGNIIIMCLAHYHRYFDLSTFSLDVIKEMIKYSYALIPNSLAWWVINVSDRTIIRLVLGTAFNGVYAIAYKIPNICSSVFGTFGTSWQQAAVEIIDSDEREKYYNKVYNKMLVMLLSVSCGILSMNSWLFNYIFDSRYYDAHLYSPILLTGTIFSSIALFYGGIQISYKMPKENGMTTVIGAVTNLVVHLALIGVIGLMAAAVSTLASQVVVCFLRKKKLSKLAKVSLNSDSIIMIVVYVLFFLVAYYITNIVVNVLSTILATIVVIVINKEYALRFKNKILKKLHNNEERNV